MSIRQRSGSIRNQIIWTFGLLLLMETLVFGLLSSFLFERSLSQTNEDYMSQFVVHLLQVTDTYISYLEDISEVVTQNPEIKTFLSGGADVHSDISDYLRSVKTSRRDITSIILISADGSFLSDSADDSFRAAGEFREEEWYRQLTAEGAPDFYLTASHVQNLIDGEYPWVISLYRRVGQGFIVVDLNYSVIEELCSGIDIGSKGYVFIVNEQGDMVYHPRIDLIYSDLKSEKTDQLIEKKRGSMETRVDGQQVLYTFESSSLTGWTIISAGYVQEFYTSLKELQFYLWLILVATMGGAVFLGLIISMQITRPIEVLRSSMKEVEKGNFDISIDVKCDNEVFDLAADCEIAIKKIKDLLQEGVREQEIKRLHELKALQAQINPHFLYNTLDSIIWLTEGKRNDDAVAMTEQLALFFRLSLSKGEEFIPVKQVYDHLKSYLTIQKMRYKNTLDFQIHFGKDTLGIPTLKLLLQPIVENSIYHGLKNREGIGHIWISGKTDGEDLEFRIEDDGVGMDPQVMEHINKGDYSHFSRSGVGVRNVAERIQLSFGQEFGLRFEKRKSGGTIAFIRVPVIKDLEERRNHE